MPRKSYKPEQIVMKLRQVDVLVSQASSVADAIKPEPVIRLSANTRRSIMLRASKQFNLA